jgi:protein-disulfide isomerase
MMDFPLESIHPKAIKFHEAANCAGDQGKYWDMHARIFTNSKAVSESELIESAEAIGLDSAAFKECLSSGKHASEIKNDISQGQKAGVRGTPSFFIGLTKPGESTVKVTKMLRGAQPYTSFKRDIDSLLTPKK